MESHVGTPRFVDYFFQAGIASSTNLLEKQLPTTNYSDGSQPDLSVIAVSELFNGHLKPKYDSGKFMIYAI
jgi:hypothetical protein